MRSLAHLSTINIFFSWSGATNYVVPYFTISFKTLFPFLYFTCFKNRAFPASFSFIFWSFSSKHCRFSPICCEKCPTSCWCSDSNPQPLQHESPPITTRYFHMFVLRIFLCGFILSLVVFVYLSFRNNYIFYKSKPTFL